MKEDRHKEDQEFNNDLLAIAHNASFCLHHGVRSKHFFSFANLFFMHHWTILIGRFSLILKWDNFYFHHSQDLLANNIVSNVSCKFILTIVVQTFNMSVGGHG
jgi:hypothetical protein